MRYIGLLSLLLLSCGVLTEQDSSTNSCRDLIESELWQEAIDCYETGDYPPIPEADQEPESYLYLLQWAASYGGKYELVGSAIIDGIFEESESDFPIDIDGQIEILVAADTLDEGVADMKSAITLINNYPSDLRDRTSDNVIYYAGDISFLGLIFSTFLLELQKKQFEIALASGELTSDQLIELADEVVNTLQNAGAVIGDAQLSSAIDEQLAKLNSEPGENSASRLESLLNDDE